MTAIQGHILPSFIQQRHNTCRSYIPQSNTIVQSHCCGNKNKTRSPIMLKSFYFYV